MVPRSTNIMITTAKATIASCSRTDRQMTALSARSGDPIRWPVAFHSSRGVTAAYALPRRRLNSSRSISPAARACCSSRSASCLSCRVISLGPSSSWTAASCCFLMATSTRVVRSTRCCDTPAALPIRFLTVSRRGATMPATVPVERQRMAKSSKPAARISDLLRVPPGPVDLSALDTRATPGFDGGKAAGKDALAELGSRLSDLQERLHAEGVKGGTRSLLLVLQGMDTSGKGGVLRHVIGQVDPQGCEIATFKAPTREELAHDFLWRIRRRLPGPGKLGVFDRSHYEDVLAVRVHNLVHRSTWSRRYAAINRFEAGLAERDLRVVKVFLHISKEEQRQRLLARLDDPTKHWKFNPRDVDERAFWSDYQQAYEAALERCNTDLAPWYRIPADRKWYRNWAVASLLVEQLEDMKLTWPKADVDVEEQQARLLADA